MSIAYRQLKSDAQKVIKNLREETKQTHKSFWILTFNGCSNCAVEFRYMPNAWGVQKMKSSKISIFS